VSELPVGWTTGPVGELFEIVGGGTPPAADASNFSDAGSAHAWLTPADLSGYKKKMITHGARDLSPKGLKSSSAKLMPAGSVLFTSRAPIGYVAIADGEISTNQGFKSFVLPEGLDASYVYYYLKRIRELAESRGTGTTFKELSGAATKELPFVVAPFGEQKRIAQKLDALLAQVDTLKTRIDAIPALLKRFRKSILASAVSGELTTEWRLGKGLNKEDWCNSAIGAVAFVTKLAGFEYTKFVKYEPGGDLSVVKAENVGKSGFKVTQFSTVRSEDVTSLTRSKLTGGEILMVFVGAGTGQVATVPNVGNWFLGPNIAMIRPDTNVVISKYLEHYCRSPQGWTEMSSFLKSTAQPCLSMKTIRQIGLPLPSIEEQTEIVRRVEQLFAFADQLEAKVATAKQRIDTLTQSLLAKAFRGELVPQDPNDEPASVLLERIRAQRAAAPKPKRGRKTSA